MQRQNCKINSNSSLLSENIVFLEPPPLITREWYAVFLYITKICHLNLIFMCEEKNSHFELPPPSLLFLTLSADPHPLSGREIVFCTAPSSLLILYERGYDLQSIKHHWGTLRSARHIRKVERGKDSPTIFHQLGKGPHGEMSWTQMCKP